MAAVSDPTEGLAPADHRPEPSQRSGIRLAVLCSAQFLLILDVAVVNVALVPMGRDLGLSSSSLQLIASAYAATFGGSLLIGGRLADRGRRRATFVAGMVVFALASLLCGLAWSGTVAVGARGVQGIGAALASPAAMSLVTTLFAEGSARDRALGVWASVAAAGGAAGLILGGVLTSLAGWRWVFFVQAPIVAVILVGAYRVLPADPRPAPGEAGPPLPWASGVAAALGVVLVVAGLAARGSVSGWVVLAILTVAVLVLVAQRALDRRAAQPLVPPSLLASRGVAAANVMTALMSAVVLGVNFYLAVHLQARLGLGPLATGLAFLPITIVSAVFSIASARALGRIPPRVLLAAGMAAMTAGCLLLARLPADGGYAAAVLPGMVLVAAGMGPGFAVGSIVATAGVTAHDQGAAAGLLSTAGQAGAAVGLALLGTVAAAASDPAAGARLAFAVMAALAVLALLVAWRIPTPVRGRSPQPHTTPAQAAGCMAGLTPASD